MNESIPEGKQVHPNATEYEGFTERYATINGIQIYYECENCIPPTKDTAILLIHGWTANRFRLHPLYIHCRDMKWPVFRIDLRGHGWSQKENITDYSIPALIQEVKTFIEQVIIGEFQFKKIILLGHSMGGVITQGVAITNPSYLHRLILVSTSAFMFDNFVRRIGARINIRMYKKDFEHAFGKKLKEHKQLGLEHFPEWGDRYRTKNRSLIPAPKAAIQTIESMLMTDFRNEINKITVPTLIVVGSKDILATPRFSYYMNSQIPNSELHIIPNGLHNIDQHMPISFHKIIDIFLSK